MKLKIALLLLFVLSIHCFSQAQIKNDSTATFLKTSPDKKDKITALLDLASAYADEGEYKKSKLAAKEAVGLAKKFKDKKLEMSACYELGRTEYLDMNYVAAIDQYLASVKIAQAINEKEQEASCLNAIGMVYYALLDFDKGVEYFNASLVVTKDSSMLANNYSYLAGIHFNREKYDSAKVMYEKAMAIYSGLSSVDGVVQCQQNIAGIYSKLGQSAKAIEMVQQSLELVKDSKDPSQIGYAYFSMAYFYSEMPDQRKAIENYKKSLVEFEKAKDMVYISNCHYGLSDAYYAVGDSKNAMEHYRTYIAIRDSTQNIEQAKEITRKELLFTMEKEQLADSLRQEQKVRELQIISNEKVKQQRIYTFAGLGGFILMLALAIVLLRSNRNKQKANEAIAEQKLQVELQKDIIEEKQREIIDSLRYAKRIQQTHLPTERYIHSVLERLKKTK